MKQPPYTVQPLVGATHRSGGIRALLLGHVAASTYYEAHRDDNRVYLLWMEFSRFGQTYAYPCVLHEREAEPMVFRPASDEQNTALMERWNELVTGKFERYRFSVLEKKSFQSIYRKFKEENN